MVTVQLVPADRHDEQSHPPPCDVDHRAIVCGHDACALPRGAAEADLRLEVVKVATRGGEQRLEGSLLAAERQCREPLVATDRPAFARRQHERQHRAWQTADRLEIDPDRLAAGVLGDHRRGDRVRVADRTDDPSRPQRLASSTAADGRRWHPQGQQRLTRRPPPCGKLRSACWHCALDQQFLRRPQTMGRADWLDGTRRTGRHHAPEHRPEHVGILRECRSLVAQHPNCLRRPAMPGQGASHPSHHASIGSASARRPYRRRRSEGTA